MRMTQASLICLFSLMPAMVFAQQRVIFSNNLPPQQPTQGLSSSTPLPPSLIDQVTRQRSNVQNPIHQGQSITQHQHVTWQSFCQNLSQHIAQRNVQYQEGFDVRGRAVAPANMPNQQAITMPQQYPVLITVNQAQMMGIQLPYMPVQADSFVGTAIVGLDGSVSFNGQDVSADKLYPMCGLAGR